MPALKICENERKQHVFGTMSNIFLLILLAGFVSTSDIGPDTPQESSLKVKTLAAFRQEEAAQEVKHDEVKQVDPPKVEASRENGSKANDEKKVEEKVAANADLKVDPKTDTKADPKTEPKADQKTDPKVDTKVGKSEQKAEVKDVKLTKQAEPHLPGPEMESGAMRRGVLVFVALGVLFIMYVGFKTYCGRKSANQSVRKYGIRGRRSDIEMTPLPLDEEDDETVFDVGNLNR